MNQTDPNANLGELLSGYMDGELTQQQRQRVDLELARNAEYRKLYDELTALRGQLGQSVGEAFGEDVFRETFQSPGHRWLVTAGWTLIIGGAVALAVFVVGKVLVDDSTALWIKLLIALPYAGLGLLFAAVLRRRLRESRTDKYNDVEI